jgi:hypothetical protein
MNLHLLAKILLQRYQDQLLSLRLDFNSIRYTRPADLPEYSRVTVQSSAYYSSLRYILYHLSHSYVFNSIRYSHLVLDTKTTPYRFR